jgi:hypothetical protein
VPAAGAHQAWGIAALAKWRPELIKSQGLQGARKVTGCTRASTIVLLHLLYPSIDCRIDDPSAVKPDSWDDRRLIPDPNAQKPHGWLDAVPARVADPAAIKPEKWNDERHGEWLRPSIPNPACEGAPGCGAWTAPMINNPSYDGPWIPPRIKNPVYKVSETPRCLQLTACNVAVHITLFISAVLEDVRTHSSAQFRPIAVPSACHFQQQQQPEMPNSAHMRSLAPVLPLVPPTRQSQLSHHHHVCPVAHLFIFDLCHLCRGLGSSARSPTPATSKQKPRSPC